MFSLLLHLKIPLAACRHILMGSGFHSNHTYKGSNEITGFKSATEEEQLLLPRAQPNKLWPVRILFKSTKEQNH